MLIRLTALHVHNGKECTVATILDVPSDIRDYLVTANKAINVTDRGAWTESLVPVANDVVSLGNNWYYANPANVPPTGQAPLIHAGWVAATYGASPVLSTSIIAELNVSVLRVRQKSNGQFVEFDPVAVDDGRTIDLKDPVTIA